MMDSITDKETHSADDPFAGDIFASHKTEANIVLPEQIIPENKPQKTNLWFEQLPKVQPGKSYWDELRLNTVPEFSDAFPQRLANSLQQFLTSSTRAKDIEFLLLVSREINRQEDFSSTNAYWLTVSIENSREEIAFEIEDAFAVWLVDEILGSGDTTDKAVVRDLTPSEKAVLEFIALNLTHEANQSLKTPLFKFRDLSKKIPGWLRRNIESENPSLLLTNWQTIHDMMPSIVKMYLTPEATRELRRGENRLLSRNKGLKEPLNRIKDISTRWLIGETGLSLGELATLETGDVVLLEKTQFALKNGSLTGRAEVYLGTDETVKIIGEFFSSEPRSFMGIEQPVWEMAATANKKAIHRIDSRQLLQIRIENFTQTEKPLAMAARNIMAEEENALTNETAEENTEEQFSGGLAVENLAVNLRVELDARRLSLGEVSNLRENQILDLGVQPTETVNLLLDNQIIGRGELVSVEDRLGVRITKLLR